MNREELFAKWYKARDEHQLRFKYPLSSRDIIFDIGSYDGKWALEMYKRYGCYVWCFEPVTSNYVKLKKNIDEVSPHPPFRVFNIAIDKKDGFQKIGIDKDASGFLKESSMSENVETRSLPSFMRENGISSAAFLKLNIEGAEYDVLENLIEHDMLKRFRHIQIQFHRETSRYEERRLNIQKELKKTHEKDYDYEFIWESWSKK